MVNFTQLRLVKFIPISNTTLVVFIPNFTATHAITSTYEMVTQIFSPSILHLWLFFICVLHYMLIMPFSTSNSKGSSEIWDKYHSCCIGNGKFHLALPREIYPYFQYNIVVFIPNFTATHAIPS